MLPRRREKPRSGIMRAVKREWPRHEAFVRRHKCSVPGCDWLPIEFAHVRTGTYGGERLKPSSWWGISLCWFHHRAQHQMGEAEFERQCGIDMKKLAAEFAAKSPDLKMKEAMRG